MSFNDTEFKVLMNECLEYGPSEELISIVPKQLLALLRRLEAAESVIAIGTNGGEHENMSEALTTWRKAAGK